MLRYLLTGLPRIRSAWFAALLSTDDVPCYHGLEDPTSLTGTYGISDPAACLLYPDWAFWASRNSPVAIIVRDAPGSFNSLERWSGVPIPQSTRDALQASYEAFIDDSTPNTLYVPYECLGDYVTVAMVHKHLTGRPLSRERFQIFDGLKIEQHLVKARNRTPTASR